jgi:hypothetical protein
MWGDDPYDYRKVQRDMHGMWVPDLPVSESISEDWVVDVDWVFTHASQYAVACVATGVRFIGDGFPECTPRIEEAATKAVELLWKRYQENVVKNT